LPKAHVNAIIQAAQSHLITTGEYIMEKQPNSRMCFVCGIDNPIGLKLKFYTDGEERCIARFQPKPEYQGYPGQLHGGIISSLLDEPTQIALHFIALLV
jgi:acyl-coenzyme A thioesterase PaaI-like protein